MSQPNATTVASLLRCARRALALLGGAFVWWLVMTGAAHAADDTHTDTTLAGATETVAAAPYDDLHTKAVHRTLQRSTAPVTTGLRTTPERVSSTLTGLTAEAPEPVRSTVADLTGATQPVLSSTTSAVADAIDRAVDAAGSLDPSVGQQAPPVAAGSTSVATGSTMHRHTGERVSVDQATRLVAASWSLRHATPARSGAAVVGRDGFEAPLPATPAGPGSAGGGVDGGALLLALIFLAPRVSSRRRPRREEHPRTGPAYEPGSSPD